ncbi:hypothetical protein BHQ23_31245 [Mycobacterium gordonae]|uniref:Uncharacterized protein n=2 Tax=Mycobacterium gordonae TaxID=1778 RepID=A0A1X1W1Y0_MYCGO|nr:hypothetical protein BHQ23_31245 [Mycobacterium gordonae]ORV80214.1 hypothetical protein AWC08_30365 [Mycobacterium gordonae]
MIGGLWPAELSPGHRETATLAEYLKVDLQRIATSANDDLRAISRAGKEYATRREAEARLIDEARNHAVRRVESTMRQLRQMRQHPRPESAPPRSGVDASAERDRTQVPSVTREAARPTDMDKTQVIPAVTDGYPQATMVPGRDDPQAEQQPDGVDRDGLADDAAKHRLRRADG